MNIDSGKIRLFSDQQFEDARANGERLIEIDELAMTAKQRENMAVSLNDTRSTLGKLLHKQRSKYQPHIGAKQLARSQKD